LEDLLGDLETRRKGHVNSWLDPISLKRSVTKVSVPTTVTAVPGTIVNRFMGQEIPWSVDLWGPQRWKMINWTYFQAQKLFAYPRRVSFSEVLFPLQQRLAWNHLSGDQGLMQLHFVVPDADSIEVILGQLRREAVRPLLVSLKKFGHCNHNYLSFPKEGFAAAIDFKNTSDARELVSRLLSILLELNGRVYLAKDSCLSESQFKAMYPRWEDLQRIRKELGTQGHIWSQLSRRLGLD
jgi:decaprenylphospho-beta-D-ribofuranose 2-oxidase